MIVREPESFSPDSSTSPGTVRAPKRRRCNAACSGGGSSTTLYDTALMSIARATAAHGWEPCTT
jgi:hypothetical protein